MVENCHHKISSWQQKLSSHFGTFSVVFFNRVCIIYHLTLAFKAEPRHEIHSSLHYHSRSTGLVGPSIHLWFRERCVSYTARKSYLGVYNLIEIVAIIDMHLLQSNEGHIVLAWLFKSQELRLSHKLHSQLRCSSAVRKDMKDCRLAADYYFCSFLFARATKLEI